MIRCKLAPITRPHPTSNSSICRATVFNSISSFLDLTYGPILFPSRTSWLSHRCRSARRRARRAETVMLSVPLSMLFFSWLIVTVAVQELLHSHENMPRDDTALMKLFLYPDGVPVGRLICSFLMPQLSFTMVELV